MNKFGFLSLAKRFSFARNPTSSWDLRMEGLIKTAWEIISHDPPLTIVLIASWIIMWLTTRGDDESW